MDKPNQFPCKLYDMLDAAEKRNEEHVISWIRGGRAFKVHNRNIFIEEYMKRMFNQTKFKSFQRQLNLWGFERVQSGPDKGSYFHPLFIKSERECCQRLTRVRLKGTTDKPVPHGVLDRPEPQCSPNSISSTTAETLSTTGATAFPVMVTTSSVVGKENNATASPVSLLGAYVDVSQPASATTTESSSYGDARQQQFADIIQYQTSQRRMEMIRKAAIGLSPDFSLAIVGTPVYATATDTSQHNAGGDDQHQQKEGQTQQEHARLPTQQMEQQPSAEVLIHQQQQEEQSRSTRQQQSQERMGLAQQSQINREQQPRRKISGLEALLSVSAQRRREEELALLRGMPHTR
eukprot:CAMPEP_0201122042 /NCGR_PEP_ID=MMETSP0850-20130426/5769_1 /ASSEMBLY_ACC=CAM_ASM_000622 /TAXON_ID=183588 /ORGANISM="Pseudo-nitzschia fraudulenta, Strain WWA7" /LENGTH=347 /DNA_ID=CAMNT_0047388625 /DNA_START=347 /DNA_END=1390 /DNA_ORIENTATION=+